MGEHLSPTGKYRLEIKDLRQEEGFDHTLGIVTDAGTGEVIAEVERNFHSFPFAFIENHPSGKSYFVCGADYQGQTVIELETGRRRDCLSDEAEEGFGFCWAVYEYNAAHQLLVVDGCIWACPYEYRLYDFSSPMDGWPQLEITENGERRSVLADVRKPTLEGDIVKFYQTEGDELAAVQTCRREGRQLIFLEEWVSEAEQKARSERDAANARYDAWLANLKATDPLYLEMKKQVEGLPAADHIAVGVCHDKWCPFYENREERRICRRVVQTEPLQIDLEWGADKGPILVLIRREGDMTTEAQWFDDHSVAGMQEAFDCVRLAMKRGHD